MSTVIKVSVPGRVCLVGEHCDYAKGMSIALPLQHHITLYGEKRPDQTVLFLTAMEDNAYKLSFPLHDISIPDDNPLRYSAAVVDVMKNRGYSIGGVEAIMKSNLPFKKGLASSAAVEVATVRLFDTLYRLDLSLDQIAEIAYDAERNRLGIGCGRMDQLVAAYESLIAINYEKDTPTVTRLQHSPVPMYLLVGIPLVTKRALQLMLTESNRAYLHPQSQTDRDFGRALDDLIPNEVVRPFIDAVQQGNISAVGDLFRKNQEIYDQYFVPVCESFDSPILSSFLKIALQHGSIGEKWTGAGGSGAFICLAESEEARIDLQQAIERQSSIDVKFVTATL